MCTILEPIYRHNIFLQCGFTLDIEIKAKTLLTNEYNHLYVTHNQHLIAPETSKSAKIIQSPVSGTDKIHASLGAPIAHLTQDPNHSQVFDEVISYLGSENSTRPGETIGAYWMRMITSNTYPILGEIALKLLAISASSACVERVFSISGRIATSARPRLSPQTISRLICVRYWTENRKATSKLAYGPIEWTNRRLDWSTAFKVSTVSALYETRLILVSQTTPACMKESKVRLFGNTITRKSRIYDSGYGQQACGRISLDLVRGLTLEPRGGSRFEG
ncbi:hypothetical protein CROQUDRAFT_94883 [Cronartium quercuum f. sp. fusiforme G11]|uniref:HAT C-terminal dimerisation domain-containing protein n=1 Tax=Cronartium quercuum f. sp. fusiforme G11 TaxID=708437 RepID=A0A9P6T9Y4_9BASI|nr:hypothetical protein CROQUDRAFT_94883 [Cronartium quercuum f. sp. fusiforme G11]